MVLQDMTVAAHIPDYGLPVSISIVAGIFEKHHKYIKG